MTEPNPANDTSWRELTDDQLRALAPFTLRCRGLSDAAVRRVEQEYGKMLRQGASRLLHHLGRPPDQEEARLLGKAIVGYINQYTIPLLLAERGRASLH